MAHGTVIGLPNLLSIFRLLCVPVLLALAWSGATAFFLVLLALALASDALDGILARRMGVESDFGARLDQGADFALWASLPLAAWWLWPEIVRREAPYIAIALVGLLLPTAIAWVKYREIPGYHTHTAKLTAVLNGIAVPLLLLFDIPWPFRIAALSMLVSAIDELGITILSPRCLHDVPSVLHVARNRKRVRDG